MTDIAVFLDRDGTMNYDPGYLSDPAALKLLPGASSAIARLNAEGLKTIVVSNQSGLGRGLFTESRLAEVHDRLRDLGQVGREGRAQADARELSVRAVPGGLRRTGEPGDSGRRARPGDDDAAGDSSRVRQVMPAL